MNNTDLNNMRLLESVLQKVLPDVVFPGDTFSNGKVRAVLADLDYEKDSGWARDAGIAWTRRHLERSKEPEPVLIIGYDREETVHRRAEGSLLENSGIAYIRLPARLEEIRAAIKSLQDIKQGELDEESVGRNIEEFRKELRSDFCHGAFGSIQRNFKGAITRISEKRYSDAAKQLMINLESYGRGKASLERIKSAFPINRAPFSSISEIRSLIEIIELPTRQAISSLESKPVEAEPYLKQIDEGLTSLEKIINTVAPKSSGDK